ncbi:MAG: SDR family NAD(P)-dependent oxidoreductase [Alphaproteobacteria bacterium]
MSNKLKEKVAIITGGGVGIGKAAAIAFAREGASVMVNDINTDAAQLVVKEIEAAGGIAAVNGEAMGTSQAGDALVAATIEKFGAVDILYNNAGISAHGNMFELSDKDYRNVMNVNLDAVFYTSRAAVRESMKPRKTGKIINVVSRVALRGRAGDSNYAAAKLGVAAFTLSWSLELMKYGINVNAVSPAAWTPLADAQPKEVQEYMRKARSQNVINRVGEAEDIVPTLLFLASSDSDYVTGNILHATGQPISLN